MRFIKIKNEIFLITFINDVLSDPTLVKQDFEWTLKGDLLNKFAFNCARKFVFIIRHLH